MEDGAYGGVVKRLPNIVRRGQQHRNAAARGQASSRDLRGHAASADLAAVASNDRLEVLTGAHLLHKLGIGLRGVLVVETVHVGEEEEGIRANQIGHKRGQAVVIAEMHLGRRDGVILINDRHRAQLTQAINGALSVAGAIALADVRRGQQHLPNGAVVAGKGHTPLVGEVDLAHRGSSLLGGEIGGARGQSQRAHARGYRTGGDDDDVRDIHAGADGIDDLVDLLGRGHKVIAGERRGADLNDDALSFGDLLTKG